MEKVRSKADGIYRILVVNPGSNSTKIAIYENKEKVRQFSISHAPEIISSFSSAVYEQYEYRMKCILEKLEEEGVDLNTVDAVAGRGGFFTAAADSGTYRVNDTMVECLRNPVSEHVANLGGILAKELADRVGVNAYITDPVCVDEMSTLAKVTGFAGTVRQAKWQPLSHKATGRHLAEELGKPYSACNLIIGHLGGGITIGAHCRGRVIDVNNGLDGDGPFSVDRPGQIPIQDMIHYCFDMGLSREEVKKLFISKGGLYSYFGTVDTISIEKKAKAGDEKAALILEALAYGVAKEIGSCAAVLKGQVDAIGLTGGLANSRFITGKIEERVRFIAPVYVFPGEFEMEALALGALRDLSGEEEAMEFAG